MNKTANVRISWWNTHLTPPKGNSLPENEQYIVIEVITSILAVNDVLFLGEVSTKNLDWLSHHLTGTRFAVKDMSRGANNRKFNMGVIYDEHRASFMGHEFKVAQIGGDNYKISCQMDFVFHNSSYFCFLVAHWPSRLLKRDDSEIRGHYGQSLRREVEVLLRAGREYVVVLGDFNDEPFNHSMTTYLRGCRDATFVRSHPELLYNPFWNQLVCKNGYARLPLLNEATGTYFYGKDNLHRWRVLDQMLFSSSFVGRSEWHLNEKYTGVFRPDYLMRAVQNPNFKLDHLPIVAELNKD